jgi:hypothetical protein
MLSASNGDKCFYQGQEISRHMELSFMCAEVCILYLWREIWVLLHQALPHSTGNRNHVQRFL